MCESCLTAALLNKPWNSEYESLVFYHTISQLQRSAFKTCSFPLMNIT